MFKDICRQLDRVSTDTRVIDIKQIVVVAPATIYLLSSLSLLDTIIILWLALFSA